MCCALGFVIVIIGRICYVLQCLYWLCTSVALLVMYCSAFIGYVLQCVYWLCTAVPLLVMYCSAFISVLCCRLTIIVRVVQVFSDLSNDLTGYALSTVFVCMGTATPRLMDVSSVTTIGSSGLMLWSLRLRRGCLEEKQHVQNGIICRIILHTFVPCIICYTILSARH
jgi:hypothetical protein